MGRPRKDGTPAADHVDMARVRNIVSQMHDELMLPADDNDYMGQSYARKCGYLEVKIEALMALLRMI